MVAVKMVVAVDQAWSDLGVRSVNDRIVGTAIAGDQAAVDGDRSVAPPDQQPHLSGSAGS